MFLWLNHIIIWFINIISALLFFCQMFTVYNNLYNFYFKISNSIFSHCSVQRIKISVFFAVLGDFNMRFSSLFNVYGLTNIAVIIYNVCYLVYPLRHYFILYKMKRLPVPMPPVTSETMFNLVILVIASLVLEPI